jgi:two-component system, cell cycle sensor histidine kinase and response regulator CckA
VSAGPPPVREDRFGRLYQRVGTGIAVAAADGRFLDVNPAFCDTVGYSAEELLATDFLTLTHPEDRPRNLELIGEVMAGQRDRFTLEKRYIARDGEPVWVRANVSKIVDEETGEPRLVATTEEITAQKAVEARLEESEALLRIAGEVGRVGGWAIDTEPVKLYWSDEIHDLLGFSRGQTPSLEEALDLYPGPERDRISRDVERCIAEGRRFDEEYVITHAQGDRFWVRVVGEPRWGPDGTVERIQGAIMDISEQKRAQGELEELADRLVTTMESITDALYTIDREWRFTYLNERAQEVLERSADGLIGRVIWDEFPAAIGSVLQEAYERALRDGITVVVDEYHYEPLDRYFSVNAYPSEQGLAVYFRDVTAERGTRLELEERGARLAQQAALLDEAQDAILVRDLEGLISFWNRGAERIYGWSAEESIGRQVTELLGLDPEAYAETSERLLTQGSIVSELTQTAKDGRELTVEARWTLVRNADGQPTSVLQIETDVTERKRMEEQFLRSQRMESIGKLAGGIAHDLNNALAPIAMAVELLREDETDGEQIRMLDIIERSARHGAEMVDQVLSFARGVDGRREPVSVAAIIEEVRRMSADTFPKRIDVRSEVPRDLWDVVGDATQLQQVLVNLCVNARDAMPGGGTLALAARNVPLGRQDEGPAVAVRVTDSGVGIPEDVRDRMFDPFFSTKPHGEGTGLGLSTTAVIVESHGGEIEVATERGIGTTFEIILPAAPAAGDRGDEPPASTPRGAGELILFVDDEDAIRQIARSALERAGYRVALATNGREGLHLFRSGADEVDVIITDLMMPVVDGYETIQAVRAQGSDVPIVATSGLNTAEASERSLTCGADRFLAKPYDVEALLRLLGEVIRTRAASDGSPHSR